jgi:hypothetical protein
MHNALHFMVTRIRLSDPDQPLSRQYSQRSVHTSFDFGYEFDAQFFAVHFRTMLPLR